MAEITKLTVKNPFGSGVHMPERFEWNRDEIEEQVRAIASEYTGIAYTEDMKKAAKDDRALLNAAKKDMDERRKAVGRAYKKPLDTFDKEVKEVMALFDEPISQISAYIKECEDAEKAEKKAKIEAYYAETAGDLAAHVALDRIWNPRWLNATYKMEDVEKDIRKEVDHIKREARGLTLIPEPYSAFAEDMFYRTLDLDAVIREVTRQNNLAQEKEERKRKEEEGKAASMPAAKGTAVTTEIPEHEKEQAADVKPEARPKMYAARYYVRGTLEQMQDLKRYMETSGIEFRNLNN